MARRKLTTSHLVAWTVPFLLVLLLVPEAPRIITTVQTVLEKPPTRHDVPTPSRRTQAATTTTAPSVVATTVVESTTSTPPSSTRPPTASSAPSSSGASGSTGKWNVTAPTPNASSDVRSGVLEDPYTVVFEPLDAGTSWTLASDGPLTATLSCASGPVAVDLPSVVVPSGSSGCQLELDAPAGARVGWTLTRAS
jgi:hypothetical protein